MRDLSCLTLRAFCLAALLTAICLFSIMPARADVYGRLRILVHSASTNAPIRSADITLHDTTGVRADIPLVTDETGTSLSPPLENHAWVVTTEVVTYKTDTRQVTVVTDTTTDVDVNLEKATISTGSSRILGNRASTSTTNSSVRTNTFIQKVPATASNPQSLSSLEITNPGFVQSSDNIVHPRGEHASTSIYDNGLLVPGANLGRAGALINPNVIQSADIITGGYAPEYGSETAAVLNLTLRSGPIIPFQTVMGDTGSFKTSDGEVTFGGQIGGALDSGSGDVPRRFRYLIDLSDRYTDNALEPPQPDPQDAHNGGTSATALGNFDYIASPRDSFNLVLNDAPARTEIGNRTGLSGKFMPVGQGFGYGGARNADGGEAGVAPDPTILGSQVIVLPSQQTAGQDIFQNDDNSFSGLNYRHTFSKSLTSLFSVGAGRSILDIHNNNPSINMNSFNLDGTLATTDNSIEFNPNISRSDSQTEVAGSLTSAQSTHTYKAGFIYQSQVGDESYQFIPQSQLALDALFASTSFNGVSLAPAGATNGATDVLGNPVYIMTPGAVTPVADVHRSGYYAAGYLQDAWNASSRLAVTYGLRLDDYNQKQNLSFTNGQPTSQTKVNQAYLSPRMNVAYALSRTTNWDVIYDKMFTQPPLSQGALIGLPLKPETYDLYETFFQHQTGPGQAWKIDYYYKDIRNQNDTGLLIPFTQIGAFTTLQYTVASVHGTEVSYNLTPRGNSGLGGYLAFTNSEAQPGGTNQLGGPSPTQNDHDQRNTYGLGVDYTWRNQAFAGLDFYAGSGEASSVFAPVSPNNPNTLNNGQRNAHNFVNLRFASPPLGHAMTLELDVANLFNSLDVLNFNSGFSGTRFQEGRRIILRAIGTF